MLVICEYLDKDNEKHWTIYKRDNEGDEGGAGKAAFFEGLGKWKTLIGVECIFATKYKGINCFSKEKCALTEKQHNELQKY